MMNVDTILPTIRQGQMLLGAGLLAGLLVLTGCDSQDLGDANPQTPTVTEIATEVEALSTFGQALQRVGPTNVLTGSEPYTVFAPLNGAFEPGISLEANPGVLRKVLQHHVVDGRSLMAADLDVGTTVQPLAGGAIAIDTTAGGDFAVNRATITNADVSAQEGVVHVVDGLLADAVDRATLTPQFTIFARLVKEADLAAALRGPGANDGRTIFAPTNAALLEAFDENGSGEIETSEIPSDAAEILQYHVLDSVFLAADVPTSATDVQTLEGSTVTVQRSNGDVTVNGNSVGVPDVEVDNGVIHGIDAVLMP